MKSSWAGALGQPQLLPSQFLEYAVDFDGDGRRDIWHSVPDSLASIANDLARQGWKAGREWGFEVDVPEAVSCAVEGPEQGKPVAAWAKLGIRRVDGKPFPPGEANQTAYLVMPAGRLGPAYLVSPNFYVLKSYNNSDLYALFIGHLADRFAADKPFVGQWTKVGGFSRRDVKAMQDRLVAAGYDVGNADGLIGFKTRIAVGLWQARKGLPATLLPGRDAGPGNPLAPDAHAASGCRSGSEAAKASSFLQAASACMRRLKPLTSAPFRRALPSCGTRKTSASVGALPKQNGPGSLATSRSQAASPSMLIVIAHCLTASSARPVLRSRFNAPRLWSGWISQAMTRAKALILARCSGSAGRSGGFGCVSSSHSMMASDCVRIVPSSSSERRHQPLRVEGDVAFFLVLALRQVMRHLACLQSLEVQRDPHALCGRASEEVMELHCRSLPSRGHDAIAPFTSAV